MKNTRILFGNFCFYNCRKLTQIKIPSSMTLIKQGTFYGCSSLTEIIIPSTITKIKSKAFYMCSSLKHIVVPSSVTEILNEAFAGCSSLEQVSLPSSIYFGWQIFSDCTSLTEMTIPLSVEEIGKKFFYNCSSLTQVRIPSSVTSIGDYAFGGCLQLSQILFYDENLTECSSASNSVSIPSYITSIGKGAFSKCFSITHVTINSSIFKIKKNTFEECTSLKEIIIPSSVESIGKNAFQNCTSLTQISIPSSLIKIKEGAFKGCSALIEITIPISLIYIKGFAFYGCSSLKEISIPSSKVYIGQHAFGECPSLKEIAILCSDINKEPNADPSNKLLVSPSEYRIPGEIIDSDNYFTQLSLPRSKLFPFINIDDYKIIQYIDRGGNRVVFKALEIKTKRIVALKCGCFDYLSWHDFRYDFIATLAFVNDLPGIAKTYGWRFPLSEKAEKKYNLLKYEITDKSGRNMKCDLKNIIYVCEYIQNGDISSLTRSYLKSGGKENSKMNPTIRSKIIFGVAATMKKLHERKIINRNLRNSNILLDDKFEPKLSSLFLSEYVVDGIELIMCIGCPCWMAPELITDELGPYSFPVDVFAYAIVLYFMFSSYIQFEQQPKNPQELFQNYCNGIRPLRPKNIPDHYWELIQNCWKQNPEERPTFGKITEILLDDKYALEEFGMKTDLNQLHEYQKRINS